MNSIIDYLEKWATIQPDKCFISFLNAQGKEAEIYTYLSFHERSRYVAEYLSHNIRLKRGDRILLVYPPGLEIIVAFMACARIGVIPVPVALSPVNFERDLAKITYIARDCEPRFALTTWELYHSYRMLLENPQNYSLFQAASALLNLDWVTTDDLRGHASAAFYNNPGPILFLQYTSGSTSDPKGVIVSHENVIHNCRAIIDHVPTGVCWLPQYHDMGLIGYYVYLVITGGTTYGFSPMDFLKRPILWLQTLSRVQATYTSSPNFGFEYCLREDKIPSNQLGDLDLSSVRVLMNASEPVRAETYRRFLERFGPYGLRPQAHVVSYGLAENTLAASHSGRRIITLNKRLLQEGRLHLENPKLLSDNQLQLVSCGRPLDDIHVRIVDPKSHAALDNRQIGEIWLAGKSTSQGYWNRPQLTHETFHNSIANDPDDHNIYLRTGDLGFLNDGELFVCGRIKDVIIIHGVNYYPQDMERIVESTLPKVRPGGVAVFGGSEEEETLIVMVEVRKSEDLPDPVKISYALRAQYNVGSHTIVFVPTATIVKTTSGKIARNLTRKRWLNKELLTIAIHVSDTEKDLPRDFSSGLRQRFNYILESYNLTGREEDTLAEIGIDSLTLVVLFLELERLLEEYGAPDLVDEIDGRLLQRLTVTEFFSLLDQLDPALNNPSSSLQVLLKQFKIENEDHERDCMRQDVKLECINCFDIPENDDPLTSVLLTGATGFFGPFLLNSLLLQTSYTYYVLVRAPDQVIGMERIRESLRRVLLWTPALDEHLEKRVRIVCGDISQQNLGIPSDLWKLLTTQVQAVIHNAALVNYVLNYEALKPHNVNGTRELLRFACTGTKKEFHFISSTIIFGWTPLGELLERENNEDMLNLDFGYAQSKWVAEQLVFAAERQGLNVRVYRPSFISASTNGIASKDDIVIRLLAFMINHGIAVNTLNQISFLPADIVAHNIAAIFEQRRAAGGTLHVTADNYCNLTDITQIINCDYGYPFVYYDIPEFVEELTCRCTKADPLYPLLPFINQSHLKIAAMQHKRYNNSRYREAKQLSSNTGADPPLRDTVSYLMAYMLREKIIRRNRGI